MYNYEYEDDILLFLRLMKFLHMEQPRTVEQIIKDYPTADEEDMTVRSAKCGRPSARSSTRCRM